MTDNDDIEKTKEKISIFGEKVIAALDDEMTIGEAVVALAPVSHSVISSFAKDDKLKRDALKFNFIKLLSTYTEENSNDE